jgi:type II secretory pathway predicted ATPase ExeA
VSRKMLLPFHSAAMMAARETASGRHGILSFRRWETVLPPQPPRSGEESGVRLLRFFDLKQDPFSDAPEEGFFYTNAAIRQVYRELINALAATPGIAALTGEAGTGKTILLWRLCRELRASGHLVIAHPAGLAFEELIAAIAGEMRIAGGSEDRVGWLHRFRDALERNRGARPPVLVIDDAERLGGDVIENLSQLLVGPADYSLRVLLCGRPEFATRLDLPGLAELKQLLSACCRLEPIDDADAASYVFHRLRRAGHRGTPLFSSAAINTVVAKAAGLPRRINQICAQSLIVAASGGKPVITSEMVEAAVTELMPKDVSPLEVEHELASTRRNRAAIAGGMAVGIIAAAILIYSLMGPAGDAVPLEGRSGNAQPIPIRLQEATQLEQAIPGAYNNAGAVPAERSPRASALDPGLPSSEPADSCREAKPESDSQGRCSNSPANGDQGDAAQSGPIAPANEPPGESRGDVISMTGIEPTAPADERSRVSALISLVQSQLDAGRIADPAGDNAVETYRQLFAMEPDTAQALELLEQVRFALWASARNALQAGKWENAQRFYELAVHPAVDIEDAAAHGIDTDVAAVPERVLSRTPPTGGGSI